MSQGSMPPEGGEERRGEAPAVPQPPSGGVNACPSNTHSLNRHEDEGSSVNRAVASVDWYEVGGQVAWDEDDSQYEFQKLEDVFRRAQDQKHPEPWSIADKTVLVHPGGIGSGRQSRMRYRIEWGPVMVGLADRPSTSRQLSNFYLKASGEACLLLGLKSVLEFQDGLIRSFCGRLKDSWLKRIDLCLDLPDVSVKDDFVPAYLEDRFVTSAASWGAYAGPNGPSGFSFGSKIGLRMNAYDKLAETRTKGADYQQAMVQYRWGNSWPEKATRIEYQVRKAWLDQFSVSSAPDAVMRLGDIVAKVTSEGPRPFLRFTETRPDRENGHQERAETLAIWKSTITAFRTGFDAGVQPLERLKRSSITGSRAFAFIRGYLTKAAAVGGVAIRSLSDAMQYLEAMHNGNWCCDEDWQRCWEQHAMRLGTIDLAKGNGGGHAG